MKTEPKMKKLVLKKETLRDLTAQNAGGVKGGKTRTKNCVSTSLCPSRTCTGDLACTRAKTCFYTQICYYTQFC